MTREEYLDWLNRDRPKARAGDPPKPKPASATVRCRVNNSLSIYNGQVVVLLGRSRSPVTDLLGRLCHLESDVDCVHLPLLFMDEELVAID